MRQGPVRLGILSLLVGSLLAMKGFASLSVTETGDEATWHYLVFEIDGEGVAQPQSHRIVRLAAPRPSRSAVEVARSLADVPADTERIGVSLLDAEGRVVHRDLISVPRWVRIEAGLHGGGAEATAPAMVPAQRAFAVRVPYRVGARLELTLARRGTDPGEVTIGRLFGPHDLEEIAARRDLPLADLAVETKAQVQPPPNSGNRLDLLLVGDGYTAAQASLFAAHAANVAASFFGISPYNTYANFVNTLTLFTASAQPGADHPPYDASCPGGFPTSCCADPEAQSDPLAGTFVQTAFDASFCAFNLHRLLVVSSSKVLTAAGAAPDWDEILVIVNDGTYGGSGGFLSVVSTNTFAVGIAQHELGHSFTGLADEYTSAYPGYPACSDVTALPDCEANVTDQTLRAAIKWTPWIEPSTPVPTPTVGYEDKAGLFQGARYMASGMYRPQQSCLMNSLAVPFCRICAQEYVRRLYQGGWGVPAAGIDNIEPGSEDPPPGAVTVAFPTGQVFSVGLLSPVGGPPVAVTWLVDGVVQPGANSSSFNFVPTAIGTYQLEVRTKDQTTLVHPGMAGTLLDSSRTWTANAQVAADMQVTQTASGASAVPAQAFTFNVVVRNNGPGPVIGATVTDTVPAALTGATWTCAASPGSACTAAGSGNVNDGGVNLLVNGTATYSITGTVDPGARAQLVNTAAVTPPAGVTDPSTGNNSSSVAVPVFKNLDFYTVTPCRLVDTRNSPGALGGPALVAGADRTFVVSGACGVPATAWAISVNVAVTGATASGNLRFYPGGTPLPGVSTLNYAASQTRGNNAVLSLGAAGDISVRCAQTSGTVHLILDVNGYFAE